MRDFSLLQNIQTSSEAELTLSAQCPFKLKIHHAWPF
jgi:hypothetical protein